MMRRKACCNGADGAGPETGGAAHCNALDALDGGIWKWNVPAGEIELSPAWLRSIGYDPRENRTSVEVCRQRIHPEDLPQVDRALDDHLQQRSVSYSSNHRIRTGDGNWLWVHDRGRVIRRGQSGAAQFMTGAVFSVAGPSTANGSAGRRDDALLEAGRLRTLGVLAAGVAHEYGNLLTAILGDVQIARSQTEDDSVRRSLDRIEQVARQAAHVTRSLLTLSQGAALARQPVRIDALIEDSVRMLRVLLPSRIQLSHHARRANGVWIMADPTLLRQVLVNLALNARDAMPSGGALHVEAAYVPGATLGIPSDDLPSDGRVVLAVGDNGAGIPEHVRRRVFEPGFSTKADDLGAGLGLAIVKGIVERHGGQVTVQSSPGRGTRVLIELPACPPEPVDRSPS